MWLVVWFKSSRLRLLCNGMLACALRDWHVLSLCDWDFLWIKWKRWGEFSALSVCDQLWKCMDWTNILYYFYNILINILFSNTQCCKFACQYTIQKVTYNKIFLKQFSFNTNSFSLKLIFLFLLSLFIIFIRCFFCMKYYVLYIMFSKIIHRSVKKKYTFFCLPFCAERAVYSKNDQFQVSCDTKWCHTLSCYFLQWKSGRHAWCGMGHFSESTFLCYLSYLDKTDTQTNFSKLETCHLHTLPESSWRAEM